MMDKQLKQLFCFTVILFAALAAMLTWYQFFRAKELWAHPFNPRWASQCSGEDFMIEPENL